MGAFQDAIKRKSIAPTFSSGGSSASNMQSTLLTYALSEQKRKSGLEEEVPKAFIEVAKKEEIKKREATTALNQVGSLMKNYVGQAKGMFEETSKLPDFLSLGRPEWKEGGPIKGKVGQILGGLKVEGFQRTAAMKGIKGETIAKLMPLLTGSVRLVASVFDYLQETLPDETTTRADMNERITQTNATQWAVNKVFQQQGFDPEFFSQYRDADLADPNSSVNQKISQALQEASVLAQSAYLDPEFVKWNNEILEAPPKVAEGSHLSPQEIQRMAQSGDPHYRQMALQMVRELKKRKQGNQGAMQ